MHRNDTTIVCRKIWQFKQFCKFQLEEGKESGPVTTK